MRKLIIDLDPGIGDAVAAILALLDPEIDLLALTAVPGIVSGPTANRNLYGIVGELDPPKWPRIGFAHSPGGWHRAADAPHLTSLNGQLGLGDFDLLAPELHHPHESAKVLVDIVREHPHQVTILTLGPLTNLAAACDRAPDFLSLVGNLVCLGGTVAAGGDATAAAEANMYLDPDAAHAVVSSPEPKTIVPLDATNGVILTYDQFRRVSHSNSRAGQFLNQLLSFSFRAHHQFLAMEGIWLRSVAALACIARSELFRVQPMLVDVETEGRLTAGLTVVERRPQFATQANVSVATEIDAQGVVDYLMHLVR